MHISGNVKAVIFDLDETLIDSPTGLRAAHKAVIRKLSEYFPSDFHNHDPDSLQEELYEFDDRMNRQTEYDRDKWWPKFIKKCGVNHELKPTQIRELTRSYWQTYARAAKPYPHAEDTLKYLRGKGLRIGLLTDTDESGTPKIKRIEKLELSRLLDAIIVSGEDTRQTKPNPEPFKLIARKLGLRPLECVMIGDKPFTDVRGAKSVGMKTVLLKRREWDSDEEPDITVKSLEEVRDLF